MPAGATPIAIDSAASRRVELRLMSLVALADADPDTPRGRRARVHSAYVERARDHADGLVAKAVTSLPEGVPVTRVVAGIPFDRGELVLVGSSRLAPGRRIFLGSTAAKILRALPVPMVVVPRDHEVPGELNRAQSAATRCVARVSACRSGRQALGEAG